ncbi:MAG: amino acid ABC transporter ATP-binding protein [bacterium]
MSFLEVKNIKKSFGHAHVLKGIDFTLEKGEVLSIIGTSGSGKTTLLRCLTFLEIANSGTIVLDGEEIFNAATAHKKNDAELRKNRLNFGLVFQNFNLFPQYTALENVMLAPKLLGKESPVAIEAYGKELLEKMGLGDKMDYYPKMLSGGQQQRVAIARALAMRPKMLFFDEPTSALDPELTSEVLKILRQLAQAHMTMAIVTHEIEFARNVSDKVIFMSEGNITEYGTAEEVIDHPKNERTKAFLAKVGSL